MIDFGFRAHDFGSFDEASSLAKTAKSFLQGCCLHFAPYKVLKDTPRLLTPEWAEQTRISFEKEGVKVAILGCYINPIHPDSGLEEKALKSFENCIEVAHALGNPIVATETGSMNPANIRCEETWSEKTVCRFKRNIERLLNCAVKNDVVMALEAVADINTIDTPKRMLDIMETFKSPNLRVLFDAVNILPIHGVSDIKSWYSEALDMLSPYIRAMHIKDYTMQDGIKKGSLPVGEGLMPWDVIMNLYKEYGLLNVPMTLENFKPETLDKSLSYIQSCCSF